MNRQYLISEHGQLKPCVSFASAMVSNLRTEDFGNRELIRTAHDQFVDLAQGKIGECIFKVFAYDRMRLRLDVNFDVWEDRNISDGGVDFMVGDKKVDVKTIRQYSKWLLIEKNHFNIDTVYAIVKVNLPYGIEDDPDTIFKLKAVRGEVAGYVTGRMMMRSVGRPWFQFDQNNPLMAPPDVLRRPVISQVPDVVTKYYDRVDAGEVATLCRMKGTNIGWPVSWLLNQEKHWQLLASQ